MNKYDELENSLKKRITNAENNLQRCRAENVVDEIIEAQLFALDWFHIQLETVLKAKAWDILTERLSFTFNDKYKTIKIYGDRDGYYPIEVNFNCFWYTGKEFELIKQALETKNEKESNN